MGLLKLIIAALIIGSIIVIVREGMKRSNTAKIAKTLNDELDEVNNELLKADVEGDVLDAKTELKARRATLDKQIVDLANGVVPEVDQPSKKETKKEAKKKAGNK